MKTITSLLFDPQRNAGAIYALSGAFTQAFPVYVAALPQNEQGTISDATNTLSTQLPEGTASVQRIGVERRVGEEGVTFNIEAVAKNSTGGVTVARASASAETTTKLDALWQYLQNAINTDPSTLTNVPNLFPITL